MENKTRFQYLQPVNELLREFVSTSGQPFPFTWVGASCLTGILENA